MSQNTKEQLLKTALAESSKLRCRQEFDRWWGSFEVFTELDSYEQDIAWTAWRACWRLLQAEYEEYVRS